MKPRVMVENCYYELYFEKCAGKLYLVLSYVIEPRIMGDLYDVSRCHYLCVHNTKIDDCISQRFYKNIMNIFSGDTFLPHHFQRLELILWQRGTLNP